MLHNYLEKYKNMSLPVRMAFWYLICNFVQKGIGMISTPIFTRIMQESEYGRYGVYSSWYSILSVIVTLSISGNCFTRGLVIIDEKKKKEELASSLLGLVITLIAIYVIVYVLFSDRLNKLTNLNSYLFSMMFVELAMITALNFWINSMRVEYKYKGIVILTLSYTLLRPILAIFLVLHSPINAQVEARVTGIAIANVILFSWIYIYIFLKGKKFFLKKNWLYALSFCIPLIPHYLSKTVLNESDRIMISNLCGPSFAGYYSVAYTIAAIMTIFNSAVAQSLDPWIYQSIKKRLLARIGIVSYKITAVIAVINFMVMSIAPEALRILAPANYSKALWVIPPVTASVFFTFMYDLFASFQFYFKKTRLIALGSCGGAVLNIILNAILIPKYGFIAAGYTTLLCYILFGILHYYFMRRVCNEFLDGYRVYDAKIIFGIGGLLIVGSFIMLLLYNHAFLRYFVMVTILTIGAILRKRIFAIFRSVKEESK